MDNTVWTVFKANTLFAVCSMTVTILIGVGVAVWRKRHLKKMAALRKTDDGPRAILLGGADPKPAHCPLCGREWPLPGPVVKPLPPKEINE